MPRLQQGDTKDLIRVGDIVILRWQDIIGHDSAWISREEVKEMKPLEQN
jgi:hypothetical protein